MATEGASRAGALDLGALGRTLAPHHPLGQPRESAQPAGNGKREAERQAILTLFPARGPLEVSSCLGPLRSVRARGVIYSLVQPKIARDRRL